MNDQSIAVHTVQFSYDSHIDHIYIRCHVPRDGIDAGATGKKRLHHGSGYFLGIRADAFLHDAMVTGHHQNRFAIYRRLHGFLDAAKPFRNFMQPSQSPGRHDQLRSALPRLGNPFLVQGLDTFYDVLQIHFKVPPDVFCCVPIFRFAQ